MTYLLDTNSCINHLTDSNSSVSQKLASKPLHSRVAGLRIEDWET